MKNKIILMLSVFALVFALAGCNNSAQPVEEENGTKVEGSLTILPNNATDVEGSVTILPPVDNDVEGETDVDNK